MKRKEVLEKRVERKRKKEMEKVMEKRVERKRKKRVVRKR